jgi:hypothetical protein
MGATGPPSQPAASSTHHTASAAYRLTLLALSIALILQQYPMAGSVVQAA